MHQSVQGDTKQRKVIIDHIVAVISFIPTSFIPKL